MDPVSIKETDYHRPTFRGRELVILLTLETSTPHKKVCVLLFCFLIVFAINVGHKHPAFALVLGLWADLSEDVYT